MLPQLSLESAYGHSDSNSLGMVTIRESRPIVCVTTAMISPLSGLRTSESAAIPMFKCLSSDDNRDRCSSSLRDRTFQAPTRRDRLRLTQGDCCLVEDTSAPLCDTLSRNLTQEVYPVLFLQSSRNGGPKGFAPIPSSGELPCEGQQHRRYSHGVGFQFSLHLWVLGNQVFYSGRSANPATILPKKKSNPTAGERSQTQLGHRYEWPLAHKEPVRPLTGFVFNPAGCPNPKHQETWWGRWFSRRQFDHETG